VVAAAGHLSLPLVVISASAGAVAGDNTAYLIGRRFREPVTRRFAASRKSRERLAWARHQLDQRGGQLILVGRFIPGGRTVVTVSAGMLRFPWPRFAAMDAVAGVCWALYAALLGYFGGRVFEHAPWKGLLLALGIGFAVTGLVEAARWAVSRRRASRRDGEAATRD
jgi:membrane protein DedA with SNARE-associated domain